MAQTASQRVLVSYSAPPPILASPKWQQVHTALSAQLPLRNIHWKSASRTSIRTIQELHVNLVPLDTIRDEHTQIPVTLLEKPLLNIYVVVCQNTDVEGYRTTVKKQIKDWHSVVTARKNQEWLILHIVRPDTRAPAANFFQLKGSVFEKIRADFNAEKRERCVQVAWSPETDTPTVWAEVINKIKDGVLSAFDSAVSQREEEESLASSFEGVNLFEDAYTQYDELENSFYHVLREKNLSWFGTLINPVSGDDSAPLLSVSKKSYRDLILANTISIFDFRIYLLARQCELLAQRGRINEICRKAASFLGAFGRRLRDVESSLPPMFIESWIYSSALSVVEYCDNWASNFSISGPKLNSFNAAKGELLELARDQLDVIGVNAGHLPPKPPFCSAYNPSRSRLSQSSAPHTISNSAILAAIENADAFYKLYIDVTNRAIEMYTKAGRKKFALRLHGSLAALDLHRGQLKTALTIYTSLPAHYAPHMWTSLESYMLSRALDTHADLNQDKDSEWIHILLSFLKAYIENAGSELLMHEEDKIAYISQLVEGMQLAASQLESDLAHPDHPAVSIQVSPEARIAETKDGCYLDVTVRNYLPCPLPTDEISVTLAGRDTERYRFSSLTKTLPSGKSPLTLFCPATAPGTYILDSSELRIARLRFQWAHRKPPAKTPPLRRDKPVLVRIPKDLLALDVQLSQPNRIELGEPPMLLVAVSTGRNHLLKASIKISSSGVVFRPKEARLKDLGSHSLEIIENSMILTDVPPDTVVEILVPHSDTSAFQAMKILTEVEYNTVPEPSVARMIRVTRIVLTALPISVNVEDFFRGTRLFSKFTISTTTHQHVRISAAQLNAPEGGLDGVKIVPCATKNRGVVESPFSKSRLECDAMGFFKTVTPAQPANFLFYIDSAHGPVRESLNLLIRYRMLREEVEFVVESAVAKVLADAPTTLHYRVTLVNKLVEALEHDAAWVDLYGITGELNVPASPNDNDKDEKIDQLLQAAKQEHRHPYPPEGIWREIKIPVDVPYMNIVAAAYIKVLATPFSEVDSTEGALPLYAGQPISAVLTIHTTFHWGSSAGDKDRRYTLRYDVEEMVRDWLVSGPKRGDFAAMDDATHTVPVTLIALHHGELLLPKVAVSALPMAGEMTMGSMAIPSIETYQVHGAEKVLVLPRGGRSTFVVGMGSS
ncbi:Trafficking protein particle complex subunit 10 [Hypsizygus marmoreus]|uniref:Trafficking protein particle complex subunit 10 n=1 Tax=Hypsizygus marmoreus TaxID=39966 RepID=A0A369JXB7_HYPMA|nr:Trafficking protein particle complex subunit 10 [Hypsizygus marmoreus]